MLILGVILLILGAVTGTGILWTIGLILAVIGLILLLIGFVHPMGPRRWYY